MIANGEKRDKTYWLPSRRCAIPLIAVGITDRPTFAKVPSPSASLSSSVRARRSSKSRVSMLPSVLSIANGMRNAPDSECSTPRRWLLLLLSTQSSAQACSIYL